MKQHLLIYVLCAASIPANAQKKRIAVMDFDYATVRSGVAQLFGSDRDVGKGVAGMLVDRLVNDGAFLGDRAEATR